MFDWFRKLFPCCGSPSKEANQSEIDLKNEGYSPKYVDSRVREVRGKLIDLREHTRVIMESGVEKPDGPLDLLVNKVCANVEKVLQNLKKDPNDMARMGLALETLDPLNELMGKCAQFAATGVDQTRMDKAIEAAKQALTITADKYDQLHRGGILHIDDDIELRGLKRTIEDLSKK